MVVCGLCGEVVGRDRCLAVILPVGIERLTPRSAHELEAVPIARQT